MTAPIVYFIDDSATMREVIKIAFRRENIDVVACHDGDSALAQMSQQRPDVVITDVIMPGKDGYEVCQSIKQSPALGATPVVLMSGVVNKQVAEKAFAVKADELIRKPFQPGDLIGRVKQLLSNKGIKQAPAAPVAPISQPVPQVAPTPAAHAPIPANTAATLSSIFASASKPNGNGGNGHSSPMRFGNAAPAATAVAAPVSNQASASRIATGGADVAKLKIEILRLEHLVKKLQSELAAEREYARALEEHIKTLQESE
ncbi:MAG TPA: response regulator [Terriglobales bacterium]|nr:response regulator [Terriglobales bacterium]